MPDEPEETTDEPVSEEEETPGGLETTLEWTGPCECLLRIEADADYLRERYQKELSDLQTEVALPGFRAGKAPMGLVERRMGSALKNDLISSVVDEAYDDAVAEHELEVVAQTDSPNLEEMDWEPGQPAQFEFRCEVLPHIDLDEGHYKDLKVEVPALEVTDALLESEVERFAHQFATWELVEGAGIDWDDYVEAELSVPEVEWTEMIGFYPRAEKIGPFSVEGIKGALTGAQAGAEVEVEAELIEGEVGSRTQLEPLAGRKVQLHLVIGSVMRRVVPEVDDDLAKKLGLSSVDEIQSLVRERLEGELQRRKDETARQMLSRQLLERVSVPLPPTLVERASDDQQRRMLLRLLRAGVPRQEAERRAAEGVERARQSVEDSLRVTFLLRKIAEKERILVTESEVDGQIRSFAARQDWREERTRTYLEQRGAIRTLRGDMREDKTLDFLAESAEIKEIAPDEFSRKYGVPTVSGDEEGADEATQETGEE